jgi:O-antigen/teichoic acid export membrane protein
VVLLFFTHSISVANLLFHVVMGRTLPEGQYGILASMLGLFLTFSTPMLALQNTIAHFSGHLITENRMQDIRALVWHWTRNLLMIAGPSLILVLLLRHPLARLFNLTSPAPLLINACTITAALFIPVFAGALQSVQRFIWMSLTQMSWGIIRLVLGTALVLLITHKAVAGLSAHLAGVIVSISIGIFALNHIIPRQPPSGKPLDKTNLYFFLSILALFSFSVLMNWDIVLVKIFFPAEQDYGTYSRASTIARTLVFLCQPINLALFPKVVAKGKPLRTHFSTLLKGILMSMVIVAFAVLLCLVLPWVPLLILFRDADPSAASILLVRGVVIAMAPLGLTMMLTNFELAQRRFICIIPLAVCAGILTGGIVLFHEKLIHVIQIFGCASYLSLLSLIGLVLWQSHQTATRSGS